MADAVATAVFAKINPVLVEQKNAFTLQFNELMAAVTDMKVALGALQGAMDNKKPSVKTTGEPKAAAAKDGSAPRKAFDTQINWWSKKYKADPEKYAYLITPDIQKAIDAEKAKVEASPRKTKTDLMGKIANCIRNGHKDAKPVSAEWQAIVKQYEEEAAAAKNVTTTLAELEPSTPT